MTAGEATFRRLVVALDASRDSLASLATWADLAVLLRADLAGLFVEDEDLQRMAGLPFARVVAPGTTARPFDREIYERLMRSAAASARAALEAQARRCAIPFSFRTVRGVGAVALSEQVAHGDLLVVEHAVFGAGAWQALRGCRGSVLYLRPEARTGGEVLVLARDVLDEGEASPGLLGAAAGLAAASSRELVVLLHDGDGERRRRAEDVLARRAPGIAVRVRAPAAASPALADALRAARGAILVASPGALSALLPPGGEEGAPGVSILLVQRPATSRGRAPS